MARIGSILAHTFCKVLSGGDRYFRRRAWHGIDFGSGMKTIRTAVVGELSLRLVEKDKSLHRCDF
jgi:hypothetical protein